MALLKQKVDGAWVTVPLVNKLTIDSTLSDTSVNPVQNKVITEELNNKLSLSGGTIYGMLQITDNIIELDDGYIVFSYQRNQYPTVDMINLPNSSTIAENHIPALLFVGYDSSEDGTLELTDNKVLLQNIADPIEADNAATKNYVDSAIATATANITTDIFSAGTTAPENTKLLWIDTANSNTMKFYNTETSAWDNIGAVWS